MTAAAVTRRAALALPLGACLRPAPIVVPFVEAHPHILFPVTVDGRPGTALLDNGVPASVLDPRFAAPDAEARQARLTLGNGSLSLYPQLADLTHVANTAEQPVHMMAGMELFLRWVVALDFAARTMSLHAPVYFTAHRSFRRLDLTPRPYRKHYVEVTLGTAPSTLAVVDLGCSTALLVSKAFAERHGLTRGRRLSSRMNPVFGPNGMVDKLIGTMMLDSAIFAGKVFQNIPIDILPADAGPFEGMDVVLGAPILNRFDLAFELTRDRLWARPTSRIGAPFVRRAVGLSTEPEAKGLLIKHVAEGSPAAAAGLKAGTWIARIDGQPADKRAIRTAVPGQRMTFEMVGGGRRTITAAYYY